MLRNKMTAWTKSTALTTLTVVGALLGCALLCTVARAAEPNYRAERRIIPPLSPSVSSAFTDPELADPMAAPPPEGQAYSEGEAPEKPMTLRDKAFRQLLNKSMPMSNEQIIQYQKELYRSQQAINTSPTPPPRPISSTITIDLSPGAPPPVIRLAPGFVTSMVFLDSTGQPWPIADFSIGNSKQFNVQWDSKKNTLFIQSTGHFTSSNLALRLADMDTPIVISLVSGQKEVDYRVDIQVNGRGPNALPPVLDNELPKHRSGNLLSVLDGIPPVGSKELVVSPNVGRAWVLSGNRLLFRTTVTVLSPAWTSTVASADGTRVYEMMTTPLILATCDGRTMKIELKGL